MYSKNYDAEFQQNLKLAKSIISSISNNSDKRIAVKYVNMLTALKSDDPTVKVDRNVFFSYFIKVLKKQEESEKTAKSTFKARELSCPCVPDYSPKQEVKSTQNWSEDGRTYIAAKPLPGQGILVYMAVSSDPSAGWDYQLEGRPRQAK